MTVGPIDSLVAEFLRRALADHALGVPKLEVMARVGKSGVANHTAPNQSAPTRGTSPPGMELL